MAKKVLYIIHITFVPLLLVLGSFARTILNEDFARFFRLNYFYIFALLLIYILLGAGLAVAAINLPKYKTYVSIKVILIALSVLLLLFCFVDFVYFPFNVSFVEYIEFFFYSIVWSVTTPEGSMLFTVTAFYSAMAVYSLIKRKNAPVASQNAPVLPES